MAHISHVLRACIVQCSGYIPPEYVKRGIYSTKLDVYSFGVLLLQIISGNKVSALYGPEENLSLLDHVSFFLTISDDGS